MSDFNFFLKPVLIFCLVTSSLLFAQDFRLTTPDQLNYPVAKTTADTKGGPSVDPKVYLLGPGDVLEIRSSKMPGVIYSGTVNESNILYIPAFGTFNVNKQSLDSTKKEIIDYLLRQNPRDEIDIILSSPKQVEVIVTGEAVNSRSYRLSGTLRVFDAIKMALKDSMTLFNNINFRNVKVTIQGKTFYYDLAGFIANGEGLENPYLYPGSIIEVTPPTKWITVSGAVSGPFPESIPSHENENYDHVFKLYKLTDEADTANIQIFSKSLASTRYTLSSISKIVVEDFDYVIVGSHKPLKRLMRVSVMGEFKNPGVYPLESGNVSTARGIISIAGGITELADSERIYIIRKDPLTAVSTRLRKEFDAPQKKDSISQRLISSGDYRIIPLKSPSDKFLENDDVIVAPEKSHTVYMTGHVNNPGAYPFVKNRSIGYYVGLAGGWAKKADRSRSKIVTVYGNYWVVKNSTVEAGDLIVVPERPEAEKIQRYDAFIKTLYYVGVTILSVISIGNALELMRNQ
jgi:protein involved in polysaccharide export with SLBB domain